jgi:poly-beta-1,6-N-acetyl-D-glucosamine synthase
MILAVVFWLAVFLIVFSYVGYPVVMWLLARLVPHSVARGPIEPSVSLIIAAYNEEKTIGSKLENSLALRYPQDKLEILVVADGSNDRTAEIVRAYADRGVRLLHEPGRGGKTAALGRGVNACNGSIVLFSDANTVYQPGTIGTIVRSFADPAVGGVSGRKIVLADDQRAATEGEQAYWSYESNLKIWESTVGSIATADGEIFAMRRDLFEAPPRHIVHDDMYLTLRLIEKGYRVVFDPDATSAEHASRSLHDEFHLKVRYAAAGYQIMGAFGSMFLPPRSGFAWGFIGHKLLRWLVPLFLVAALASSAFLSGPLYRLAWWLQVSFYGLAAVGYGVSATRSVQLVYFPLYFCTMNVAFFYGLMRAMRGGQSTHWRKAER